MNKDDELKPCPGCQSHGDNILSVWTSMIDDHESVECAACGLSGPDGIDRDEAVAKWNALPRTPAIQQDKVDIEKMLLAAEPYLSLMKKAESCIDGPLPDRWHYLHKAEEVKQRCADAVFAALNTIEAQK